MGLAAGAIFIAKYLLWGGMTYVTRKLFISSQNVVVSTHRKKQTNRKFTLPLNSMWKYFYFIKVENDSAETLFCISRSSLIAFRGIKQSLPTMKKGVQKICWQHIQWTQFWKIEFMVGLTEPIHSPVSSWHTSLTMAEKLQEVSLCCKQHAERLPWPSLIPIAHWDIF